MAQNCLLAAINWLWEDPAVALSGGDWVATDTVKRANLLNTRTTSYARTVSAARGATQLRVAFAAARRVDHLWLGYLNATQAGRVRVWRGAGPLNWDFADLALPEGMTCTRALEASYWTADGVMAWAAVNEPRYDHDPMTGAFRGLLVERSADQYVHHSEDLSQWTLVNATVDVDAGIAPDGEADWGKIEETTANGNHGITLAVAWEAGLNIVAFFAEPDERGWLCARVASGATVKYVFVNTLTGAAGHASSGVSDVYLEPIPGGRYRVSFAWTAGVTAGTIGLYTATADGGDAIPSFTGTSGSGLYVWGISVDRVSTTGAPTRPSSYIRNAAASTRSRPADAFLLSGAPFRAFVPSGATEVTLGAELAIAVPPSSNGGNLAVLSDGTSDNLVSLGILETTGAHLAFVVAAASLVANMSVGTMAVDGTVVRMAVGVALNDARLAAAGSLATADTSVSVPAVDRLALASPSSTHFRRVFLVASRLADADLQAGTTDFDDLSEALPTLVPWTSIVPTTHTPIGGYLPFGRPSVDGKMPDDERDPRGVSRLLLFDAEAVDGFTLDFDDTANPDGHLQLGIVWAGYGERGAVQTGFQFQPVEEAKRRRTAGGALHARSMWKRRRAAGAMRWRTKDEALATWFEMQRRNGLTRPILFTLQPGEAGIHEDRMTVLGVLEEPTATEHEQNFYWGLPFALVEL